jgi:hypothetical protein
MDEFLLDHDIPRYAILSHTWGEEEVIFEDLITKTYQDKTGYEKIKFCGKQATADGFTHFWIDSCCIKKSSDPELSEAINSMYRWYKRAAICYVYLSDVPYRPEQSGNFLRSRWFTRGWTLQELLAPASVEFFSKEGTRIGSKRSLEKDISAITGIPASALRGATISKFGPNEKFKWAKDRTTTREEDMVYSLLGLFNISMPVIYGEGIENARRRLEDEIREMPTFHKILLGNLRFKEFHEREYAIPKTYKDTYRWIFNPPTPSKLCSSFVDWINSEEQLYWITGKAGSGKSTLMKFIREDKHMRKLLQTWAKGRVVNLFSFYFWNSGSKIQMSQEGLLRTILIQALGSRPELASILFPHREEEYDIDPCGQWTSWSWAELLIAFQVLITNLSSSETVVLLIDGLDEYDGHHDKLVEFIQNIIGQNANIKVCVSSRPWVVFEDAFHCTPSLRLEDLTRDDIKNYIDTKLESHPVFKRMKALNLERVQRFVDDMIQKASGVFLWVALVVQSFQQGLSEGEHLTDLQRRLDALPPDLEDLYWKILKSLDPFHYKRTCQFFRVIMELDETETLGLWAAIDMEESSLHVLDWTNVDEVHLEADLMRRRLNASTRGLIHTIETKHAEPEAHIVTVLHRTVADFIRRPDIRPEVILASTDYDANFRIARAYVSQLPSVSPTSIAANKDSVTSRIQVILNNAMAANIEGNIAQANLIDQMNRLAGPFVKRVLGNSTPALAIKTNWRCMMSSWSVVAKSNSFLQFAVAWQLTPYVKNKLARTKITQGELEDLLSIALLVSEELGYSKAARGSRTSLGSNISLISIILARGANPNSSRKSLVTGYELKKLVRQAKTEDPELIPLFQAHARRQNVR